MREYVAAVRAIWQRWQNNESLDFKGLHYTINLMPPLFDPGPIEHPDIPVHLAAVNRHMCQVAGEVADGVRPHPICSAEYIANVMIPEVRKGAAKASRSLAHFNIWHKPLIATADTPAELALRIKDLRARLAFYVSTPSYRPAVEYHGFGELARKLSLLARSQEWERMPDHINDDVLEIFAVVGTYAEIAEKLRRRFGDVVTSCEFSIPVKNQADKERLAQIVKDVHTHPPDAVRRTLGADCAET